MGQMMGGGGTSGGGDPFAADPFATAGGFSGGGGGGGGGGFGDTGATSYADPNAYDYSGGGQGGAPNEYAYPGGEGATGPWGNQGGYQNPTPTQSLQQSEQMGTQGSAPPPPQTTAPGGQQSASPSQPSWVQEVSNLLLGKNVSNLAGTSQAEATSAAGGPPMPTDKGPGWFASAKPSPIQLPTTTAAEYAAAQNPAAQNPANAAVSASPGAATADPKHLLQTLPWNPADANKYTVENLPWNPANADRYQLEQLNQSATPGSAPVPTPRPRPAEAPQAPAAAPGAADAATVSPQSSPDFGKKSANQAAAETAPGADTGPASTAPDIAGSAREAGMGPPATAGQGMPQGMGGKGNALGDLLTLNFGRFLGDLFGGQGGQGTAGVQPVGQPRTAESTQPYRPADEQPREWGATSQGYAYAPQGTNPIPGRPGGMPTGPSPVPVTPTGVPGQPSINRAYPQVADVGQALKPQAPGSAAATGTPEPVGTPGTMTVTPMGQGAGADNQNLPAAWPVGKPPDYFQRHGGRVGHDLQTVQTPFGPVTANRQVANDFAGLTNEMKQAGVPGIHSFGSFNPRPKRYGRGFSSHAFGAAFDINNEAGPMRPETQQWINQHPQQWQDMLRRHNFAQYMPTKDPNHLEWVGPVAKSSAFAAGTQGWGDITRPPGSVPGGVSGLPHEQYASRVIQLESGGNPNARTGNNRGLGQFGPAEERRFGITPANRNNPNVQRMAIEREGRENGQHLQRAGVQDTPENRYLLHQQGQAGGTALLTADPNTPAWQAVRRYYGSDAVAQRAIKGNIPSNHPLARVPANQITAGQFRELWQQHFAGQSAPAAAQNPANAAVATRPSPGAATAGTAEEGARVFGFTPGQGARLEPGDRVRTTPHRWDPNDPMNTPFRHHGGGSRG